MTKQELELIAVDMPNWFAYIVDSEEDGNMARMKKYIVIPTKKITGECMQLEKIEDYLTVVKTLHKHAQEQELVGNMLVIDDLGRVLHYDIKEK